MATGMHMPLWDCQVPDQPAKLSLVEGPNGVQRAGWIGGLRAACIASLPWPKI